MEPHAEVLPADASPADATDGAAYSSAKRQRGDYGEAARRNFEMHAARETSRQAQLSQLKMAVEQGEVLSKNAQKRLIKLEHRGERREKTKVERQRLKHARREGGAEPLELRLLVRRRDEAQAGAVAAEEEGGGPVARQAKPPSAKRRKARPS